MKNSSIWLPALLLSLGLCCCSDGSSSQTNEDAEDETSKDSSADKGTDTDECPDDPDKTKPGNCGCGIPEGSCGDDPDPQCPAELSPPAISGCNGVPLTDPSAIETQSDGIATSQGPLGATGIRIEDGQSIDILDEGCLQLGKNGADFSLSLWLRATGSSQIIGTTSQYSGSQGFVLITRTRTDGDIELVASSVASVDSQERDSRNVVSAPFKANDWVHVAVLYDNNDDGSTFGVFVNMAKRSGSAHPDVYNDNLRIGDVGWGTIAPFEVSELQSYGRVLSEAEIKALFLQKAAVVGVSKAEFSDALARVEGHMSGSALLSVEALEIEVQRFVENALFLETDAQVMGRALDLVETFETSQGPLFMTEATQNGISRVGSAGDGLELARAMVSIQQAVLEQVFTASNVAACRRILDGRRYLTADYFPGAAEPPEDPSVPHEVEIRAELPAYWGRPVAFATAPARRPTGLYLSPGSVARVTASQSMVDAGGFEVLVGAHTADHSNKSTHKRLDRVSRSFPITQKFTHVANPLGGGIYIVVPYLADLGQVTVQVEGAIEAPFFSLKTFNQTTSQQWLQRRTSPGPWADFETDKFMMQVPSSWIYAFDDPKPLLEIWDKAMDGVSELVGYPPEKRNQTVLYQQIDVAIRHGVYGIGYPQINNTYNPRQEENGNKNHWMLTDPTAYEIDYHELGHAQLFSKFRGETEALVNFPHVYVRHVKFGVDFDTAFQQSFGPAYGGLGYTPDDAAIHWMIAENFRNGKEMDHSNTTKDEFRYQHRGYAKYADIYRIFGWQPLRDFYYQENVDYMSGASSNGLDAVDSRILRLSVAAGGDVTPLVHFWGIHPVDPAALQEKMAELDIKPSTAVRQHIERYKTIAPSNNEDFNAHFERIHPGRPSGGDPDYGLGWYNEWRDVFNETHAAQIQKTIQSVIDLYYPK